ncbi:hypothetical protein [Pseudomonas aeruginosa]|nr:hypothetical protein [Pseudomonas aeruginosa]
MLLTIRDVPEDLVRQADAHAAAVQLAEIAGQRDMLVSDNPLRPGYRRR